MAILDLPNHHSTIDGLGPKTRFFASDVSVSTDIEGAIAKVISWANGMQTSIAAVVCCAGIMGSAKVSFNLKVFAQELTLR